MATAAQLTLQAHERPACPKCNSPILVRKHGTLKRQATGLRVQMWGCRRCRRWFTDPSKYVGRKGRLPNLELRNRALMLRRAGKSYPEIGREMGIHPSYACRLASYVFQTGGGALVGRRVVFHIRPELVKGLAELYTERERSLSLAQYAQQLFEDAIISRRAKKLRGGASL